MRYKTYDINKDIMIVTIRTLYKRLDEGDSEIKIPKKIYTEKQLRKMSKKDLKTQINYMLNKEEE